MLTEAKNQLIVTIMSIKYSIMREMVNRATFLMNILFMIINDASFIIQWVVLYKLKNDVGGYTFNQVLMLWGLSAEIFGISRLLFKNAFHLSEYITNGKLDSYLVQPKNVLLGVITSDADSSALGDIIYGYILLFFSGITLTKFILFTLFFITGGIIVTAISIILSSLSFWIKKSDIIAETGNSSMTNFSTYPDGIFKGAARAMLYSIVPVGFTVYIPVQILTKFNLILTLSIIAISAVLTLLAFAIFYKGLKKYSSSNLMMSKI